jgi:uncharacterized protein YceK
MIRPQSTRKAKMKTILMLIVGLMLAGCGSMETMFETMALPQPPGSLCRIAITVLRWTRYALALDD